MRKLVLALVVVAGLLCTWFIFRKPMRSKDRTLRSYFSSGSTLRPHAPVCVDGVVVGEVASVRVRPELGERPVEVQMTISTSYELGIPNDAMASLSTEGVLGQTFVEIETRRAHGAAIANDGVLNSSEVTPSEGAEAVKRLGSVLVKALGSAPADEQRKSPDKSKESVSK